MIAPIDVTKNIFTAFGMLFQGGENHVLFTRPAHIFQAHLFGDFQQFGNWLLFEFSQVHRVGRI